MGMIWMDDDGEDTLRLRRIGTHRSGSDVDGMMERGDVDGGY